MKRVFLIIFLLLFLLFPIPNISMGSTIIEKSFEELVNEAELIFEGYVLSKETRPSPKSGLPFTYFTFEIIDIVKGEYADQTIELGFMGGTLDGYTVVDVSDMKMPKIGEKGIYFVKKITEQFVNPLIGWHQGHYLVIESDRSSMELVIPLIQQDIFKNVDKMSKITQQFQSLKKFKQEIRDIVGGEQ